ncbi:MAG: hypothetical protein ACKVQK_01115 [Burkholderiales bacterium]
MFHRFALARPLCAAALLVSLSLPTVAEDRSPSARSRPNPAEAAAPVSPLVYQSTFSSYRGFAEQAVQDWRESNDNVGRIGGWRSYAREAQPSKPAAKNPIAPAASGGASDAHPHH